MNHLAKHFFDYQSFVNLPYKAVQLHKTPPSQAGADPSAQWCPKSMQMAGKNQPAPAARSNRNNVEIRHNSHRHGRPSKLEFRTWGDRHGELHPEKNVPHKDAWMASLDGEFKHFHESDDEHETNETDYIPRFAHVDTTNLQILVILTYAPKVEFITVTIKKLRGFGVRTATSVKIQIYEGIALLEERQALIKKLDGHPHPLLVNHYNPGQQSNGGCVNRRPGGINSQMGLRRRHDRVPIDEEVSESFLLHASPHRLPLLHVIIQLFDGQTTNVEANLGSCIIGLTSTSSRGSFHWRQMIKKQGIPNCLWHKLSKPVIIGKEPVTAPASAGMEHG